MADDSGVCLLLCGVFKQAFSRFLDGKSLIDKLCSHLWLIDRARNIQNALHSFAFLFDSLVFDSIQIF